MDYERIQKNQAGGGFSPGKLRTVLLGVEKKRKEGEDIETAFSLRSQVSQMDHRGDNYSENFKDVDVVSILPECSTSVSSGDTVASEIPSDRRMKDNSRNRFQDDCYIEYDGHDGLPMSSPLFEFQKGERAPHRVPLAPFSKPAPSKWDDAQKWIASPTSNRPKTTAQSQAQNSQGIGSRKTGSHGHVNRQPLTKVVVEVPDQRLTMEEPDTKRIDTSQVMDRGGQKLANWDPDSYPIGDSYSKSVLMIENSVAESAISLSRHDSAMSIHSATTFIPPPSTARSVSMRDMGTEMTPIASQEPSRTGTPVRATTPIRSPTSSQPTTPRRAAAPASSLTDQFNNHLDPTRNELSEKEIQMKTRREIMVLGTQLGKTNIAAWASKEEEDSDASTSLKNLSVGQPAKNVIETHAAAWEEAEKAKFLARFKREEIKIQAWENHQKAKTEAEMRKIEVEVERMRGRAHDRLMNKLAAARHKAEEKLAAAEAKRNEQAAKTEQQADYIRRTGRVPTSFFRCTCCCS